MWKLNPPKPVKCIVGILAADNRCLEKAGELLESKFGPVDLTSDIWPFTQTDYYKDQTGANILRRFVSFEKLICPRRLAAIKHKTNRIEQQFARKSGLDVPRPINLDPGYIGTSKLVLATTKNYSHRIYIGKKMYAEVTLIYEKGQWKPFEFTYPDYREQNYMDFFSKVRNRLMEQLRSKA